MDIFGIGILELVVIGLVILIVAGPKRSAAWAKQSGEYLRQFRTAWQNLMEEARQEMGPEGEELMKAADDLRRSASELRQAPRTMLHQLTQQEQNPAQKKVAQNWLPTSSENGKATENNSPVSPSDESITSDDSRPAENPYSAWQRRPASESDSE
jgi:Sec-independent protein translocase protein TatA